MIRGMASAVEKRGWRGRMVKNRTVKKRHDEEEEEERVGWSRLEPQDVLCFSLFNLFL